MPQLSCTSRTSLAVKRTGWPGTCANERLLALPLLVRAVEGVVVLPIRTVGNAELVHHKLRLPRFLDGTQIGRILVPAVVENHPVVAREGGVKFFCIAQRARGGKHYLHAVALAQRLSRALRLRPCLRSPRPHHSHQSGFASPAADASPFAFFRLAKHSTSRRRKEEGANAKVPMPKCQCQRGAPNACGAWKTSNELYGIAPRAL